MFEVREEPKPLPKQPLQGIQIGDDTYYSIGFYRKPTDPSRLVILQVGESRARFADRVSKGEGGSFSISKRETAELIAALQEMYLHL